MTLTIQQAIDIIISSVPGAPFSSTVDTVKAGDPSQELTGIVVTFMATCEVIEQAAGLGANFIITHEPTFYNHRDDTAWLTNHPLYASKRQLIEDKNLVIWRFHDYLHSIPPDRTLMGLMKALRWEANSSTEQAYISENNPYICSIEQMTLREVGQWVKDQLRLQSIRIVGDLSSPCQRIALLPGAPPSEWQMGTLLDADVLIVGEINEWETSEYVRDANHTGLKKGLIVIGHAASEEPGMRLIVPWLEERLPDVTIHFVLTGNPFQYL